MASHCIYILVRALSIPNVGPRHPSSGVALRPIGVAAHQHRGHAQRGGGRQTVAALPCGPRVKNGPFPGSAEQSPYNLFARQPEMLGDFAENCASGPDAKGTMVRDCYVMLTTLLGGETHVTAAPAGDFITECTERSGQILSADIARQLHAVRTSSRTKCRRMIFGVSTASK